MTRKLYLEKYLNCHNIENYTLSELDELMNVYKKYLNDNGGRDIQFPGIEFKTNTNG